MCTRKCSLCIAGGLYPLALISIICNIILFFPGLDVKYALNGQITEEVKKLGGLVGGGVLSSGQEPKPPNSFEIEVPGHIHYLEHPDLWGACTEPKNVVKFNVVLFSILLVVSSLQIILCAIQMINGLFGCLCGTCRDSRHTNITVTSAVNVSL
ncbi:transmembrane 4 L6 family member 4 [Misgurnus anguillicaudatus]|uniref:transmembrane 4 L6 family member 4 n=1 Tax=Misgurnus anguillicaudatus TaxID=75329 RepID=UPI003CCEFB81